MNEQRIHVMHILHRFATGGLENGLVNIINRLPESSFRHTIVCITDYDPEFCKRLTSQHVEIVSLNKAPGRNIGYLFELRKLTKKMQPNIIHSRGLAALEAQISSMFLPVSRVHGEHGWDSAAAKNNKKYVLLRKLISPLIKHFVVLSQEGHDYLCDDVGIHTKKIDRICNGVDTDKFMPVIKEPSRKLILTTVGRLAGVKNQQLLIKAVAKLVHQHHLDNIELRIVGEGECRTALSELIAESNLNSVCFLLGQHDDVHSLLAKSDVFILPSFAEGISNTILESMACGIPVVASNVGGNTELVQDSVSGSLFESDNVDALVSAILPYIKQSELRQSHGNNARQQAVENFSLNKMVARYHQLYLKTNTAI